MTTTVPSAPGALPGIGHFHRFARHPVGFLESAYEHCGEHFRFKLLHREVHALISPQGQQAFFSASPAMLSMKEAYRLTVPIFGKGVTYDLDPPTFDAHIALMHRLLNVSAMSRHIEICVEEVQRFSDALGPHGRFELKSSMDGMITRIICRCFIGDDFDPVSDTFHGLFSDLEGGANPLAMVAPWFPSPANLRRDRARRDLQRLLGPLIRRQRGNRSSDGYFLSGLIAAADHGTPLDDYQIVGWIITLIFSARSSTSTFSTRSGMALLKSAARQAVLREEARAVIGDGPITFENVRGLVAFERFLKEVERLYPPIPILTRAAMTDFPVGNRIVPKGALVMVSPPLAHRLPAVFAEPERFQPSRFGPGRQEDRRMPASLIGFGAGKNRCLGYSFAHQVCKVVWTRLPQTFSMTSADTDVAPRPGLTMLPNLPPVHVDYVRRSLLPAQPGHREVFDHAH